MPLKSQAQAAYLRANAPDIFQKFVSETPKGKKLPKRVKPKVKPRSK